MHIPTGSIYNHAMSIEHINSIQPLTEHKVVKLPNEEPFRMVVDRCKSSYSWNNVSEPNVDSMDTIQVDAGFRD